MDAEYKLVGDSLFIKVGEGVYAIMPPLPYKQWKLVGIVTPTDEEVYKTSEYRTTIKGSWK